MLLRASSCACPHLSTPVSREAAEVLADILLSGVWRPSRWRGGSFWAGQRRSQFAEMVVAAIDAQDARPWAGSSFGVDEAHSHALLWAFQTTTSAVCRFGDISSGGPRWMSVRMCRLFRNDHTMGWDGDFVDGSDVEHLPTDGHRVDRSSFARPSSPSGHRLLNEQRRKAERCDEGCAPSSSGS